MAFQLLDDLETRVFKIRSKGGGRVILERVGTDDFRRSNFFVHVGLEPSPLGGMDYFFSMIEVDAVLRTEFPYFSGRTVAPLIEATARKKIRGLVLRATRHLLEIIKPDQVHRCTHDPALPEVALEKHHAVSEVFDNCGYKIGRSGVHHGRRFWVMERK